MVRFDRPCFAVNGAVEYFREHMALGEYLTQEGKVEMTWVGKGAEQLGLAGQCERKHFELLCRGFHPVTGQKLMVRDKGARRRVCFFGQISPPKDVSILYLVAGDRRIGEWWREAVAETLHEIEAVTATRVRKGGTNADRSTDNFVAAIVTHDANRDLDPQLHTHLCLMNLTFDAAEGRWKSLQPSGYYRHQGFFREVCYNRLATRMLAAGYELEPVRRVGFAVKGLPSTLRDTFSKRRRDILQRAAAAGATSQDDLQDITLHSRKRKTNATAATLRARWIAECGADWDQLFALVASANGNPRPLLTVGAAEAVRSAERHVFERRSVVDERVLLREALVAGRGQVSIDGLRRAVAVRERAGDLIRSGDDLASRIGLDSEREFTGWAHSQLDTGRRLGTMPAKAELDPGQLSAVRGLLAAHSRVVVLQGDAGTGKTRCLKTIALGVERAGGKVFGCAPSAGATEALRAELSRADTLQQLLVNVSLQEAVRGQVLVVDEAGFVSVREMRDLCRLAERNANRLLLVGDVKQHSSVEAGDALRALQKFARVPVFHLTEIRRQRDPAYRAAVALLAKGNAYGAFMQFKRLGAVRQMGQDSLWTAAAADYVRTVLAGKTCLAISPVWSEIHRFTGAVREQMKLAGLLGTEDAMMCTVHSLKLTAEERRRAGNYRPGDVLTFHRAWGGFRKFDAVTTVRSEGQTLLVRDGAGNERRIDPRRTSAFDVGLASEIPVAKGDRLLVRANLPAAELRNGDLVEVESINPDGSIRCRDGRVLPGWFREFSHGYATTSHGSQGKTVDRGLLLMADEGIAAGNLKQAYVSNSRFRESQMIYTSDQQAACEAMMRPADRKLAMELTERAVLPEELPCPSLRKQLETGRVGPAIAA